MKKRFFLNKKAYFFLIDALLALGVIAVGTAMVFTLYTNVPSKEQPAILSDDLMDFFANNKIKDVNNEYVGLGGTLWETEGQPGGICNGEELIANGENTLLQQVAIFYEKSSGNSCYLNLVKKFILKLTENTLPTQYGFEFWMDDQLLYPETEQTVSKSKTKVLIPSKKIAYGIMNQETGDMFGPYNAEVLVWQ
jgi:hypothetical protein|tara:strand:+ start:396 stop:977 length:582 start_codon:yes stop_codon:yes gene_type:complete